MSRAKTLYQLQEVDIFQAKIRRRLLTLQKVLTENEALEKARAEIENLEAEVLSWQQAHREAALESEGLEARIQEAEQRLMSGVIHNPKELESLQASVAALRRQKAAADDQGVQALEKLEKLQASLEAKQAALAELEKEWQSKQAELQQELTKRKQEYVYLKRTRTALAQSLDEATRERYEFLRKRKQGRAVAKLVDDSCSACYMQVPKSIASAAYSDKDELVFCPNCGRILWLG